MQGAFQPELSLAKSEKEKEVAPPLIRSQRSRGSATSEGVEVAEGPQSEALLASLITSGEGTETQLGSPRIMMPALRFPESSPTTEPIGRKAPVVEAPLVQLPSLSSEGNGHEI